jgi:hypothetical protein
LWGPHLTALPSYPDAVSPRSTQRVFQASVNAEAPFAF